MTTAASAAATLEQRFWASVNKTAGCWEWAKSKHHGGYGAVGIKGKALHAHRVAWELTYGPIPKGQHVLHHPFLCNNASCVRPDHLYLGTHADNMRDRTVSGRTLKGEKNPGAKLTRAQVEEIRQLKGSVGQRTAARMYAVTKSTIARIYRGETWTA